jgi:hypothetical protein
MTRFDRSRLTTRRTVGAAAIAMAASLLLMAMFLSASLQSAAYDMPPNPTSEAIVTMVDTWHGWMETIGAAAVSEAVVSLVSAAHVARFGD